MMEPGQGGVFEGGPVGLLDEAPSHEKSVHKIGASVRFKPESVPDDLSTGGSIRAWKETTASGPHSPAWA